MRQWLLLFIDLFLIVLATVIALVLRDNFEISEATLTSLAPYLVFTLAAAVVALPTLGTNRAVWRFTAMADYLRILAATAAIVAGAVAVGFGFNRLDGIARALPILQGLLILFALVGVRILMRLLHVTRERPVQLEVPTRNVAYKTVLIVGLGGLANLYLRSAAQFAPGRVRIAGFLGDNDRHIGRSIQGHPVLGTPEQIAEALRTLEIHGVFVDHIVVAAAFEKLSPQARDAVLSVEKETNINLEFLIDQMGFGQGSSSGAEDGSALAGATNSVAVFSLGAEHLAALTQLPYWRIKRALDFIAALSLLVLMAPLTLLVAALVAVKVGLPVTFWQQRPGLNGRPFKLRKFRTMAAAHDTHGHRVPDEARTSGVGRFLRRTRLDELPQLLNILTGEMSFVGPRPLLPVDQPAEYAARLLVRPGLTGWAQVKGGREVSPADKAALDVWYVRNASLALDLEIMLCTVTMVTLGERVDAVAVRRAWRELRQAGICSSLEPAVEQSLTSQSLSARQG
jgi:lipopolysaccharide/colanic/teichoic acid biosynthesis glycosyltransferase